MKNLLILIIIFTLCSCGSSDDEPTLEPFTVSNLQLIISDVGTQSASINLFYNSEADTNNISEKVFYKSRNQADFTEASPGTIINLEKGIRYTAYATVSSNGESFESPEQTFITKGFNHDNPFAGRVMEVNKRYSIFNISESGFDTAPALSAYLKVGNDSIAIQTTINSISIDFEIIDSSDLQGFFDEGEAAYTPVKEFTIGLFSGEYYLEIENETTTTYEETSYNSFSFFNIIPRFKTFTQYETSCVGSNGRDGFVYFGGDFWSYNSAYDPSLINVPEEVTLRLTNINDNSIERTYFLSDLNTGGGLIGNCVTDKLEFLQRLFGNGIPGFHKVNLIYLRFDPAFIIAGEYEISLGILKDNNTYLSEKFPITIE